MATVTHAKSDEVPTSKNWKYPY